MVATAHPLATDQLSAVGHEIEVRDIGNGHGLTIDYDTAGRPLRFAGGADPEVPGSRWADRSIGPIITGESTSCGLAPTMMQ